MWAIAGDRRLEVDPALPGISFDRPRYMLAKYPSCGLCSDGLAGRTLDEYLMKIDWLPSYGIF